MQRDEGTFSSDRACPEGDTAGNAMTFRHRSHEAAIRARWRDVCLKDIVPANPEEATLRVFNRVELFRLPLVKA